jgi:hypothetical protein
MHAGLEARRPHKICTPFRAEVADGSGREMLLPADGAMVQADPEYRESHGYVGRCGDRILIPVA